MKKVFKKAISMTLALAMMVGLMSAMTVQAAAAGPEISNKEIKTVSGYTNITLTPQEGDNGVDKFALSFKGAANTQYVVFLLNGNEIYPTLPDKDNIRYIDQKASAADGTVSFNIYPDKLPSGKYAVYVSSTKCECLATFDVKAGMLGDVTLDGKVNVADVMKLARYVKNSEANPIDDAAKANADVTGDDKLNVADVMKLARYVKNPEANPLV